MEECAFSFGDAMKTSLHLAFLNRLEQRTWFNLIIATT